MQALGILGAMGAMGAAGAIGSRVKNSPGVLNAINKTGIVDKLKNSKSEKGKIIGKIANMFIGNQGAQESQGAQKKKNVPFIGNLENSALGTNKKGKQAAHGKQAAQGKQGEDKAPVEAETPETEEEQPEKEEEQPEKKEEQPETEEETVDDATESNRPGAMNCSCTCKHSGGKRNKRHKLCKYCRLMKQRTKLLSKKTNQKYKHQKQRTRKRTK